MPRDSTQEQMNFYLNKKGIGYLKNSISFIVNDFLHIWCLVIGKLS